MELEWDWPGKAEGALPAAKLENRFEDVHTRCGTGAVLYTEHQPTEPTLYSIHTDHLGTPMELAECDGKLAWVGHYRAWGKLTKASDGHGNPSTTDNPLRFQGQYLDEETGLHYNRHRYYDPETGRFTTQDPIGLAGGENLYMYAPNPTGWVDPLGLSGAETPTRRAEFRAAKRQAGIPQSSQFDTHKYVYDNNYENRTVYQFGEQPGDRRYVVLHEDDQFGRGPHFHGATDSKGDPMEPGRYDQLPGHHPEDDRGFSASRRGCSC
ncbi:MAG: hypothetical protein GYB54_09025 [Gammaproteobacteria bacterium]|nr:hypothetical protein [Gammaproteobacteria bacterium]